MDGATIKKVDNTKKNVMDIICHKGKWIKLLPILLNSCAALLEK
jgi:hypothetical protein